MKARLSTIILTHNEEANLPACLDSLRGLDCETFVVDSGSTDQTVEIAREAGAVVVEHPFENYAALRNLPISTEWVMGLDADQRLTHELVQEIREMLTATGQGKIDGFYVKRRQVFRGRWIKHGGYYPKYLLKLMRRDKVRTDGRDLMDHHFYVEGNVGKLKGDIVEENSKEDDISFWIDKHNRYAGLLAEEEILRTSNGVKWPVPPRLFGSPDQRVAWLKKRWYRLPLYMRPCLYFFYRYFLRLGFLDGKEGFIFHFLQGFWFRLMVDIKIDEMRKAGSMEQGAKG